MTAPARSTMKFLRPSHDEEPARLTGRSGQLHAYSISTTGRFAHGSEHKTARILTPGHIPAAISFGGGVPFGTECSPAGQCSDAGTACILHYGGGLMHESDNERLWNGAAGCAWVDAQEALDQMFKPFEDLLVDAVSARSRSRVLD